MQIDAQHPVPIVDRDVGQLGRRCADAGIVDGKMQAAKLRDSESDSRFDRLRIADIDAEGRRPVAAEFIGKANGAVLVEIGDDDGRAFIGEVAHDRRADARSAAGDDRNLILKQFHIKTPFRATETRAARKGSGNQKINRLSRPRSSGRARPALRHTIAANCAA